MYFTLDRLPEYLKVYTILTIIHIMKIERINLKDGLKTHVRHLVVEGGII